MWEVTRKAQFQWWQEWTLSLWLLSSIYFCILDHNYLCNFDISCFLPPYKIGMWIYDTHNVIQILWFCGSNGYICKEKSGSDKYTRGTLPKGKGIFLYKNINRQTNKHNSCSDTSVSTKLFNQGLVIVSVKMTKLFCNSNK